MVPPDPSLQELIQQAAEKDLIVAAEVRNAVGVDVGRNPRIFLASNPTYAQNSRLFHRFCCPPTSFQDKSFFPAPLMAKLPNYSQFPNPNDVQTISQPFSQSFQISELPTHFFF